jgi:hypothetical protein
MHPIAKKLLEETIGIGKKAIGRAVDSFVEDVHDYSAGVAKRSAAARAKIREQERIEQAKRDTREEK